MSQLDTTEIRNLPIKTVAARLGIKVLRGNKAMCFTGHDKNTPSLSFNVKKNYWHCFGCDRGGDSIALTCDVLRVDFKTATVWLADQFHLRSLQINRFTPRISATSFSTRRATPSKSVHNGVSSADFSPDPEINSWLLSRCGPVSSDVGIRYLKDHGISQNTAERFGLRELTTPDRAFSSLLAKWGASRALRSGLAWSFNGVPKRLIWGSYSIIFPFLENNKVVYLQGRLFAGNRKYINPQGLQKPIFNADRLKSLSVNSRIHICEGVPDALALETFNLPAVAVLGASSFRPEWARLFMPFEIAIMPDGDSGGTVFLRKISAIFRAHGKATLHVALPQGQDVSDVAAGIVGEE